MREKCIITALSEKYGVSRMHVRNIIAYGAKEFGAKFNGYSWEVPPKNRGKLEEAIRKTLPVSIARRKSGAHRARKEKTVYS